MASRPHDAQPDRTKIAKPIIKIALKKRPSAAYMALPTASGLSRFQSAPYRRGERASADDLAPEMTPEPVAKPSQVFQGRQLREEASWLSKIFFSYPKPLLDIAERERITFEQYGDLPEHLRIEHEIEKMEKNIDYYVAKDPKDENAVFKGVLACHTTRYILFCLGRLFQSMLGIYLVMLMKQLVAFVELEKHDDTQWWDAAKAGLLLVLTKLFTHTFWENMCYYMIETGHKTHTTLKTLLFKKNFRLSAATNKNYSSGEILNLIERDANRIWVFVWDLPALIEVPFEVLFSSYVILGEVGVYAFAGLALFGVTILLQRFQSGRNQRLEKEMDKIKDKRMMQTSEVFNHAKNLKLYNWEQKFGDRISSIYDEEMKIQTDKMGFNGMN